ncbi:hypothetical protein SO802_005577 [Lithocarpus litseifolius]|uniref:Uncharacterized protein n=1 Tax=Lithocarpus litseifolius TaxID=425828 RepID=A0AAW2DJW4_9ROSI
MRIQRRKLHISQNRYAPKRKGEPRNKTIEKGTSVCRGWWIGKKSEKKVRLCHHQITVSSTGILPWPDLDHRNSKHRKKPLGSTTRIVGTGTEKEAEEEGR